jgi:AcrR family transcriptional regulator
MRAAKPRPRSADTRERIVLAARRQFAASGYDQTTIRSVAQEAQIDPSLVMRYFGTKDGLFAAAAKFELHLPQMKKVSPAKIGEQLVRHFLHRWEGADATGELPALLRVAATNATAAKRLEEIFLEQILPVANSLPSDLPAEARAALMATQMLGLAYGRYVVALPAIVRLDPETIVKQVAPTIRRYLIGR